MAKKKVPTDTNSDTTTAMPTIALTLEQTQELLDLVKARHRSISAGKSAEEKLCAMIAQFASTDAPIEAPIEKPIDAPNADGSEEIDDPAETAVV